MTDGRSENDESISRCGAGPIWPDNEFEISKLDKRLQIDRLEHTASSSTPTTISYHNGSSSRARVRAGTLPARIASGLSFFVRPLRS